MRSLINVKDILTEYTKPMVCPLCNAEVDIVQSTVELTKDGAKITKLGICREHGTLTEVCRVKTITMSGGEVRILP